MPTLVLQTNRRVKRPLAKRAIAILSMVFSAAMVWGRLLSGVHWLTDILGSLLLSAGLFSLYRAGVLLWCNKTH
jgi:undecaprenyl-diphosphatase